MQKNRRADANTRPNRNSPAVSKTLTQYDRQVRSGTGDRQQMSQRHFSKLDSEFVNLHVSTLRQLECEIATCIDSVKLP